MKPHVLFSFSLLAVLPFLMPRAAHSKYFKTNDVGQSWRKNGTSNARIAVTVTPDAPRPLYVEALLPDPGGSAGETISKTVRAGESDISFEGPVQSGWRPNKTYVFRVRAYADAAHKRILDSLEQHSVCVKPPGELLRKLKSD
jgi:hypothetical protein